MRRIRSPIARMTGTLLALLVSVASTPGAPPDRFELKDGDRVVLIGGTFIERDQSSGYLETLLTKRFPDRHVVFRNLGWSGDTVFGPARARFGPVSEGFDHLRKHVETVKPTVIVLAYGMNESFEGRAGLSSFLKGLDALLDMLRSAAGGARLVFISPIRHEDMGRPLPDPAKHNADLAIYVDALRAYASKHNAPFVDLFDGLSDSRKLTDNGIHLTHYGYWLAARVVEESLGFTHDEPYVAIDAGTGKVLQADGATISDLKASPEGVSFTRRDDRLPDPRPPREAGPSATRLASRRVLAVVGLKGGERYEIRVDGKRRGVAIAERDGRLSLAMTQGPEYDRVEALRSEINKKNELYFHRWRPQNETYLFGFRKHEQGNNAREIPMFDPLISAREAEIAKLRKPSARRYEVVKFVDARNAQ